MLLQAFEIAVPKIGDARRRDGIALFDPCAAKDRGMANRACNLAGHKPKRDEEIEANLDGRIITVRVMNVTENPSNARGELGSPPIANTIGRFVVAAFAANAAGVPLIAAIRVTFRRTKSADKVGNRW